MTTSLTKSFPISIIDYLDSASPKHYNCVVIVTAKDDVPNIPGRPLLDRNKITIAIDELATVLSNMTFIEVNNQDLRNLIEPKNGFNMRDFLVNIRNMPLGNSQILGTEYPPNTLDRQILLITNGFDINIDFLEIEIGHLLLEKLSVFKLHPYDIDVELSIVS